MWLISLFQKSKQHNSVYKSSDSQHGANYHADGSHKSVANGAHYGAGYGNKHGSYGHKNANHHATGHSGGNHPTSYHNGYGSNSA